MFDFFIEAGEGIKTDLDEKTLFSTPNYCHDERCKPFNLNKQGINVHALGKNKDFPEIYQNKEYLLMIFGYCFTRASANNGLVARLQAEELQKLYQKNGKNIVKQIKGSYVVIVYHFQTQTLDVFTDELNIRTVYFARYENKLLLSSSLSAFINYSSKSFSTINSKSVLEYALFDFILTDETFLKDVQTLAPAAHLNFSGNVLEISIYHNLIDNIKQAKPVLNEQEAFNQIEQVLKKNLSAYLSEPEKTAFALTGGYDSRTNLALLNGKYTSAYYYSYGIENSYDIKFAQRVAKKLKLNFQPIILDNRFAEEFAENALTAIKVGDGIVEMTRANYIYAFKNLSKDFDYILTGLFGSELIKRPTSLGGYIDKNIQSLLFADNFEDTYQNIIDKAVENGCVNTELLKIHKKEILQDLKSNPYIYNTYPEAQKYFYYMVGWGMRKYFMKEIKAERLYVENLHPYMDIEFIELLLKTPFPWLYHWDKKKNLLDNLKIHKFYAQLMHNNNKKLGNIPTTHAYKPKYLLNKVYLPLLILQYAFLRRKIKKTGIFNNTHLMQQFYLQRKNDLTEFNSLFNNEKITGEFPSGMKEFNKLISLQLWFKEYQLKLS